MSCSRLVKIEKENETSNRSRTRGLRHKGLCARLRVAIFDLYDISIYRASNSLLN